MADLKGKAALVTGGGRGIGAAIARRLAADGAAVAITYVSAPDRAKAVVAEIEALGGKALAIHAPAQDAVAVVSAVDEAAKAFGRLDILVNNAGIGAFAPIDALTLEAFDDVFAVNVRAVFVGTQAALKHMGEGGRIITIGSINADRIPFPGGAAYAATKAAVQAFTRGIARDLGPRGITANVVQPGPVDTELNPADGPFADILKPLMAIPKYAEGEDVAGLVSYLAGPESRFVTGAALNVDGGFGA